MHNICVHKKLDMKNNCNPKQNILAAILCTALLLCSCASAHRDDITYFQDVKQIPAEAWNQQLNIVPRLQPNDEFSIVVSAVDQSAAAAFNKSPYTQQSTRSQQLSTIPSIQTYRVDERGDIDFPVLGTIHVKDMSALELKDKLTTMISQYVKEPMVTVNFLSLQIVVLGEVNAPGIAYFDGNRATLLEALGKRGDLTVYGKRDNVMLIREQDGKRCVYNIDLTSAEFINSPYYYLQQNDVIYVSPNTSKKDSSKFNSLKSFNISLVGTIVSCVSVLTSLAIALWK